MRWLNFASGMALFFISFPANWLVCLFELWTCKFSIVMCQWPAVSVTKHRWFPPPIFRPISNTDPPFFSQKSLLSAGAWVKSLAIWLDDVATFFFFVLSTLCFYFRLGFCILKNFFWWQISIAACGSLGWIYFKLFSIFLAGFFSIFFFFLNWSGIWQFSYLFIRWEIA